MQMGKKSKEISLDWRRGPLENCELFPEFFSPSRDPVLGAPFFGCAESHKDGGGRGGADRQGQRNGQCEQGARPPDRTGMTHPQSEVEESRSG